jgi:release factor glutamine methyltransferase
METLQLLNSGSKQLKSKRIISHKIDSEILLSKVLKKRREEIISTLDKKITPDQIIKFKNLIKRRSFREPIAYITKEKEFWSKIFEVNKNTLIPRPETELMVEKLTKIFIISLLSELKKSNGIGLDISGKSILIAKKNADKHLKSNNLKLLKRSFTSLFNKKFDLIVSNPPYIMSKDLKNLDDDIRKFEPKLALDGGNDGLDVVKKVIYKAKEILKINGTLALEIGNGQYNKVSKILLRNKFIIMEKVKDYNDNIRCLISKLNR